MTQDTTPNHKPAFTQAGHPIPELSASIVSEENGKNKWKPFFAASQAKDGYYRGKDKGGNTIIVQTRDAKTALLSQQGETLKGNRIPDLFIYREDEEDGKKIWTEILVAWKGKEGYFTARNAEGHSVVIQTREAREASFKTRKPRRMAALDLNTETLTQA